VDAPAPSLRAPRTWWRAGVPAGARRVLAALRPRSLGADLLAVRGLMPGVVLVSARVGPDAVPEALV
jgi:hypothetical protein